MSRGTALEFAAIALLTTLLATPGCIFDCESVKIIEEDSGGFADLTEPEHVIQNIVRSYETLNIEEYTRLLLSAEDEKPGGGAYPSAYLWYNQEEDAEALEGEVFITRAEDKSRTNNIFLAAMGTPASAGHLTIDRLTLAISGGGVWSEIPEVFSEPCSGCWMTVRPYEVWLYFGDDRIHSYDNVEFIIVPVMDGDTKIYKIAVAMDIHAE
jgi:hypothetical protein